MSVMDMLISYLMKGGIVSESRNVDVEMQIPNSNMVVKIKAEHVMVRVEKESKEKA